MGIEDNCVNWHRRVTVVGLIACLLISGCSSNVVVRENEPLNNDRVFNYDQLNDRLEDGSATIICRSGVHVDAAQVHISGDSVLFAQVTSGEAGGMSLDEVRSIRCRDHGQGAWSGFFTGMLGGVALTAVIIMINNEHGEYAGLRNLMTGFCCVVGSGVVGAAVGAALGSAIEYNFQTAHPLKPSLPVSTPSGAP
jgi:hypothetical protein